MEQYEKPSMDVIELDCKDDILTNSCNPVNTVETNLCPEESLHFCVPNGSAGGGR